MEYTTLGDTGMEVSRICLGCMSFGTSDWRDWVPKLIQPRQSSLTWRPVEPRVVYSMAWRRLGRL